MFRCLMLLNTIGFTVASYDLCVNRDEFFVSVVLLVFACIFCIAYTETK